MSEIYDDTLTISNEYILSIADKLDTEARFPLKVFDVLGENGLLGLLIPKEYGGVGQSAKAHAEACMALSEGSASVGLCYMMHNVVVNAINRAGNEKQKELLFSECIQNKAFFALAVSENESGVDTSKPSTTVKKIDENTSEISGSKFMVTSGGYASHYLLNIYDSDKEAMCYWIVPKDLEGVTFKNNIWNGLGMRANESCPMDLNKVTISNDYFIGYAEDINANDDLTTPYFVLGLAAVYSGLTLSIRREAIKHSVNRKYPDGTSLKDIDIVKTHLSKIYCLAEASKSITLSSALELNEYSKNYREKIIAARITSIESAMEAAKLAMRIGGGKSYNKLTPIERLLRDSYAGQVMIPSVDNLNLALGKLITTV